MIPGAPAEGIAIRTLLAGRLPLLVADLGAADLGAADLGGAADPGGVADPGGAGTARVHAALVDAGLEPLGRFLGADLPKGAKVGFVLDAAELRLVDDRDDTLLRAPRDGIDPGWIEGVRRLRGTMVVAAPRLGLTGDEPAPELARHLDEVAQAGRAIGAVVGVVEERPTLPLLL